MHLLFSVVPWRHRFTSKSLSFSSNTCHLLVVSTFVLGIGSVEMAVTMLVTLQSCLFFPQRIERFSFLVLCTKMGSECGISVNKTNYFFPLKIK